MRANAHVCLLIAGAFAFMNAPAHAELNVGDQVPAFKMVGSDGKTYTNEQFKGKSAFVIAWYPKAFTGG